MNENQESKYKLNAEYEIRILLTDYNALIEELENLKIAYNKLKKRHQDLFDSYANTEKELRNLVSK